MTATTTSEGAWTPDRYAHIIDYVGSTPWAVLPEKLAQITALLRFRADGGHYSPEEIKARLEEHATHLDRGVLHVAAAGGTAQGARGAVAVIPLVGTVVHRADMFEDVSGLASIDRFRARLRDALNTEAISSIVIDVDSPGGVISGVEEMAQEIMEARDSKKIIAVANSLMASAAYWIASAASEIVATPSGHVGSIGVFAAHLDMSAQLEMLGLDVTLISAGEFKTEGNPFEALTEEARDAIQDSVNLTYSAFVGAVAKGRGVTTAKVRGGFGQGRVLTAGEAKKEGMVDRVATLDDTVARLLGRAPKGRARAEEQQLTEVSETDHDEIEATTPPPPPSIEVRRRRLGLHRARG